MPYPSTREELILFQLAESYVELTGAHDARACSSRNICGVPLPTSMAEYLDINRYATGVLRAVTAAAVSLGYNGKDVHDAIWEATSRSYGRNHDDGLLRSGTDC